MKKLSLKHLRSSWHGWHLLLLPLALLFALWTVSKYLIKMISKNDIVSYCLSVLYKLNVTPATSRLIIAQAAHETGNFTSAVFQSNNNMFGMKYVGQANAEGEKNGYANYKDLEQCLKDYVSYYTRSGYPKNYASVVAFVSDLKAHNYFEADTAEYINGVNYFYKKYFNG